MNEKKLKICHFTYSFFPLVGGMEEVIHNLSLAMLTEGCEPYVFAPRVRGRDNRLDVPYKVLRYSRPSSRRFGLRQLLIPLLWNHWKYKFDILHCHGVYPTGYVGALFQKISRVPFLITSHGGDIKVNEEGHIIDSRITGRIKKYAPAAKAVTIVSSEMKNRILFLGIDDAKIQVVPNGISPGHFKQRDEAEKTKDPYMLYLGRLRQDKGADIAIEAFSLIREEYPSLRLKIAGDGRENNNLKAIAEKRGISSRIDFLGMIRGAEKTEILSKALFLLCPSRREAFGIVNLEAFASGLPVIASKIGGIPDIVNDGENGFLVAPENPAQLADKMRFLLEDHALRKYMSRNALQEVSKYDWHSIVQKYIAIYREML